MTRYAELKALLGDVLAGFIPDLRQHANELHDCCPEVLDTIDEWQERLEREYAALALPEDSIRPIDRDEEFDRTYIPLPGGWEVNDKGAAMTRYEAIEKALREIEAHHVTLNKSHGRDESRSKTLRIARAALALPEDSKTVNAELYGLAVELADFRAKQFAEVSFDPIMRESKYCKDALRYLSLREASGEPMPYKVVRDGDKVRFE